MPPPSFLEQAVVMKGMFLQCLYKSGALNVFSGVSKNGISYGVLMLDFILRKMLENDKYSEVIAVSLGDRSDHAFSHFHYRYGSKFRLCSEAEELKRSFKSQGNEYIKQTFTQSPSVRVQKMLYDLQTYLVEKVTKTSRNGNSLENNRIGVLIYSMTELVSLVGEDAALSWLYSYSSVSSLSCIDKSRSKECAAEQASRVTTCCLLHSTLHPDSFRNKVENICNTLCRVLPTYGQYHSDEHDICCTTETIRKAPSTGKVGEGRDVFANYSHTVHMPLDTGSLEFYELNAIVTSNSTAAEDGYARDGTNNSKGPNIIVTDDDIVNTNTLDELMTEESASNQHQTSKVTKSSKEMLVVFDRSDPEFESDSDPDDDLDL